MAQARDGDADQRRGSRLIPLALFSTFAASAAVTVLVNDARKTATAAIAYEPAAQEALTRIGLTWASVRIEDGVARIEGIAPNESERVIAFATVRDILRPAMGRTGHIEAIASHVALADTAQQDMPSAARRALVRAEDAVPPPPHPLGRPERSRARLDVAAARVSEEAAPAQAEAAQQPEAATAAPTAVPVHIDEPDGTVTGTIDAPVAVAQAPALDTVAAEVAVAADAPEAVAPEAAAPVAAEQTVAAMTQDTATPEAAPANRQIAAKIVFEPEEPDTPPDPQAQTEASQPAAEPVQTAALQTAAVADTAAAPDTGATRVEADPAADCKAEFADVLARGTIEFGSDSAVIARASRPLLDKLARIAKRCERFYMVVSGHTDATGRASHNLALSKKRAEAVRWALVDRGVDMDHITAEGLGSSQPLVEGNSDTAKARNRRIEFSVLEARPGQDTVERR